MLKHIQQNFVNHQIGTLVLSSPSVYIIHRIFFSFYGMDIEERQTFAMKLVSHFKTIQSQLGNHEVLRHVVTSLLSVSNQFISLFLRC